MNYDTAEKFGISDELQWGLNYRQQKKKARRISLMPKSSPIDIQFLWYKYQITRQIQDLEKYKKQFFAKPAPKFLKSDKLNLVDRSTFTRTQYINFLSTPQKHDIPEVKVDPLAALKNKLHRHCSARLMELAKPPKVRVISTWNSFAHFLTPEVVERLQGLLRTDRTLEPSFARCCFKDLDKEKRKVNVKRTRRRRKVNRKKRIESQKWLKLQVLLTANVLIEFLYHGPLLALNYRQMLISNSVLTQLARQHIFKRKPSRTSKKPYEKAVVDVVDQLSIWIDAVVRYSDIQESNSDHENEDSAESLLGIEEGEEEEDDIFCDDTGATSSDY